MSQMLDRIEKKILKRRQNRKFEFKNMRLPISCHVPKGVVLRPKIYPYAVHNRKGRYEGCANDVYVSAKEACLPLPT
jgi:hypothetical protein